MTPGAPRLARDLGLFDATMLVMGSIIGSGIFISPAVVAQQVHTPLLIEGAWIVGGIVALLGARIYAELSQRLPHTGGQYVYLREAYGPMLAFLYGWTLLLIVQTGGMAVVCVTFARYTLALANNTHTAEWVPATIALAAITLINCLGVKSGGRLQSLLMLVTILAATTLIVVGLLWVAPAANLGSAPAETHNMASRFGAALIPVLFSYGGYQTACFVVGEMKRPRQDLPRALLFGVLGVALLYCGVSFVCLRAFGANALATTAAPASRLMQQAVGNIGAKFIAFSIAISALGFLSRGILTAPRVYFAMAKDGVFWRQVAWVSPRTRVPIVAILLQSALTLVLLLTRSFEQMLAYVVAADATFFALSASTLLILRHRGIGDSDTRMPLHPWTTLLYVAINAFVVVNAVLRFPGNALVSLGVVASGIPAFLLWRRSAPQR